VPWSVVDTWPGLSPSARAVAVAIGAFIAEGRRDPTRQEIGARAGLRRLETVRRALRELLGKGLLVWRRRPALPSRYAWRAELADPADGGAKPSVRPLERRFGAAFARRPLPAGSPALFDDELFLKCLAREEARGETVL
jgi:hypothetical protein